MKRQNAHIDDDLVIRYLAGEVTEQECTTVENWLAESAANRQMLAGYQAIFEESKALKPGFFGNADKAWDRFKQKIDEEAEAGIARFSYKKLLGIAAGILVVLSVGIGLYIRRTPVIRFYAHEQPLADTLPDGSLVSLNSHSSLVFKPGKIREAALKGEAFFDVKHDAGHPFRIKVNNVLINVLGTSFNVKGIGDKTEIIVRTGIVGVSGDGQSVRLQAGEQLLTTPGKNWHKEQQTNFDINRYPGLLRAILKDPTKWPELLKNYKPKKDTSATAGRNRALIREIIHQFITERIVPDGGVRTFRLDDTRLIINGVMQPATVQQRYKAKYLPSPNYFIYFGKEQPGGNGICVNPDQL